ncbi:hypothetical protein ABEB36_015753 [Hypothenemus hampei]|uniref:SWIM-type domain-containing protein n=1 Tax=Hypothenemus hampei TaxID=57062 RepID=A0ABD1DZ06_HYPHA
MHRTIKYVYLQGKNSKRLDKTINILMSLVRDKLYDRIITLHKGKISSKLSELRKRHYTSTELKNLICENGEDSWIIQSTRSAELYNLRKENINCDCKLRCGYCNSCIHQYTCTCIDSAVKWNMCKHIHYLCTFLNTNGADQTGNVRKCIDESNLLIDCDPQQEVQHLIKTLVVNSNKKKTIDERKEK